MRARHLESAIFTADSRLTTGTTIKMTVEVGAGVGAGHIVEKESILSCQPQPYKMNLLRSVSLARSATRSST